MYQVQFLAQRPAIQTKDYHHHHHHHHHIIIIIIIIIIIDDDDDNENNNNNNLSSLQKIAMGITKQESFHCFRDHVNFLFCFVGILIFFSHVKNINNKQETNLVTAIDDV
jgi:hypothetical protein